MSCAHREVQIDVFGPADTVLVTTSLYCSTDTGGEGAVKKWAREEASRRGIVLGAWTYLRATLAGRWDGRVYGRLAQATDR